MNFRHLLPLAAVISIPVLLSAQLDPRERYGTYVGGGVQREFNANCPSCPPTDTPASTTADRVVVDSAGNIYVAGHTSAIDFPTTSGAYRTTIHYYCARSGTCGSADAFLVKFDRSGRLVWSTYLGAGFPGNNAVLALALDTGGNVAVVGSAGTDQPPCSFPFFLKLNPDGSAVVFSNSLRCNGNVAGLTTEAVAFDPA